MRFLFAAGGTGGHVIPALVVAQKIKSQNLQAEIIFVGTAQGMENTLVPKEEFSLTTIPSSGIKGKGILKKIQSLTFLPVAFFKSWRLLRKFSPHAVFGIGGYASGPLLMVASLLRCKTAILEPNAVPGFANRILSRFVNKIFVAFEQARSRLPLHKAVVTGNPIRQEILMLKPPNFEEEVKTVLVFGGSQGARKINEAIIEMLPKFSSYLDQVHFIHQAGRVDVDRVRTAYQEMGFCAEVKDFFLDMAQVYQKSHLVIARSGSSVLEIAACGRPSVLIPYPYAADDHQQVNAKILERLGASFVIQNSECNGARLAQILTTLIKDSKKLKEMSKAALGLRAERAASTIARELVGS